MLTKINVDMLVTVSIYPPITAPNARDKEPTELRSPNILLVSFWGTTSVMYANPIN